MSRLLKGNYKVSSPAAKGGRKKRQKKAANLFEEKAFQKLGGSIAFVMKSDKFIWDGDEKAK